MTSNRTYLALTATAVVGFSGAAAVPAGYLVYFFGATTMLPPVLGILALAGSAITPTLLPARPCRRRAHTVTVAERASSPIPRSPVTTRRPASARGEAGRRAPAPGRAPADPPIYRPGRATVHTIHH